MKRYNIFTFMISILLFSSSHLLASIEGRIVNVKRSTNIGSIVFNEADQSLLFKENGDILTKFLENDNYLVVEGWACNTANSEESTSVELFVGDLLLARAIANLEVHDMAYNSIEEDYPNSAVRIPYPNEAKSVCNGRTNIGYRFILHKDDVFNSKYSLRDYQYQNIRVEGITLTGAKNVRLANSDRYQMPFMDNHPLETVDNDSTPPECTEQEKKDIQSASSSENIILKCSLTLNPGEAVQGKIIIGGNNGSNISIDCNDKEVGGLKNGLVIRSAYNKVKNKWDAPEGIVVKNCRIEGQLLIIGIPPAGDDYRASSRTKEHPFLKRAAAPKHILLENNIFHGKGKEPIYIAPGAGYVTIKGSRFTGKSEGTVIYLDAETYRVSILNNSFTTSTQRGNFNIFTSRELIAIDGSSHNLIKNNVFHNVEYGGIFIYRNCGESGITRHTTPVYNRIIKNKFHFDGGWFSIAKDAVHIASRNGDRSFCDDENGTSPYGSASSDRDQAMFNVVIGNDFFDYPDGVGVQNNEINNVVMRNKRH